MTPVHGHHISCSKPENSLSLIESWIITETDRYDLTYNKQTKTPSMIKKTKNSFPPLIQAFHCILIEKLRIMSTLNKNFHTLANPSYLSERNVLAGRYTERPKLIYWRSISFLHKRMADIQIEQGSSASRYFDCQINPFAKTGFG